MCSVHPLICTGSFYHRLRYTDKDLELALSLYQPEMFLADANPRRSVGNQQEWDTMKGERSWVEWRPRKLPEGSVVANALSRHDPGPPIADLLAIGLSRNVPFKILGARRGLD